MAAPLTAADASKPPITGEGGNGLTEVVFMDFVRQMAAVNAERDAVAAKRSGIRSKARAAGIKLGILDKRLKMAKWEPADVREEHMIEIQYSRWLQLPGYVKMEQQDLFPELDPTAASFENWHAKGFLAATTGAGVPGKPPEDCPPEHQQSWMEGWHSGQVKNAPNKLEPEPEAAKEPATADL